MIEIIDAVGLLLMGAGIMGISLGIFVIRPLEKKLADKSIT